MTIDKRINFRGGGMDMGNTKSQARSASMANTPSRSRSTSTGTGGSSGNLGGGGGGQNSDYRRYEAPTRPTYTSKNIDQKPITGDDFRRSQNEFIDNLNRNNASRFEPSFFNRTYKPVTMDQIGSRNQPPDYGNILMGGILGLINPLAGRLYSGYNFLKDKGIDFYQNMQSVPVNDTIDIRENFDRSGILSEVQPVQTFEFDSSAFNTELPPGQGGLTIAELQALIDNATINNSVSF